MNKKIFLFLCCFVSGMLCAQELDSTEDLNRVLKEFRCVTCPNQNIVESNAAVAVAMREQISAQLAQGQSIEDIRLQLLSQYGDYISYRPVFKKETLGLWVMPCLLFLGGMWVWFKNSRVK